jgi:hypothetical protein
MMDSGCSSPIVFGVGIPALEQAASTDGVTFESIMKVFNDREGGYLQRCLGDLREAIRAPKDTGFFYYRAVESLRQFFASERGMTADKASWEMLRSELGIDRADIDAIKLMADHGRHGISVAISDDGRAKTLRPT